MCEFLQYAGLRSLAYLHCCSEDGRLNSNERAGLEVLQEALPTGSPTVSNSDVPPVPKPVASDMVSKN